MRPSHMHRFTSHRTAFRRRAWACLIWLFAFTGTHAVGKAQISGVVRMYDDAPHVAVAVQAIGEGNEVVAAALTDARGSYRLEGLKPGSYRLRAMVQDGFEYFIDNDRSEFVPDTAPPDELNRASLRRVSIDVAPGARACDFRFAPFKKGRWQTWTTLQGLPGSEVRKIVPDSDGSLWIGTIGGLSRFDGKQFWNLTTRDGLLDNQILNLLLQTNGSLWICSVKGISRLNVRTIESGRPAFDYFTSTNGLGAGRIDAIAEGPDGSVWTGGHRWMARYSGAFRPYGVQDGFPDASIGKMAISPDGMVWMGMLEGGFGTFDGGNFKHFPIMEGKEWNTDGPAVAADGSAWVGTQKNGVWNVRKAEGGQLQFRSYAEKDGLNPVWFHATHVSRNGDTWFAGTGGISRFNGRTFVNWVPGEGMIGRRFITIGETADGVMWFGSSDGLSRYDPKTMVTLNAADGLESNEVWRRLRDRDGNVWVGTSAPARGQGGLFHQKARRFERAASPAESGVYGMSEGEDGAIWFATLEKVFWGKNGQFNTWAPPFFRRPYENAKDLEPAGDGKMWIACDRSGLQLFNNGKVEQAWLMHGEIAAARLQWHREQQSDPQIMTREEIGLDAGPTCVRRAPDGTVWIGTWAGGIVRLRDGKLRRFTTQDGLAGNNINCLYLDRRGRVWIGTQEGLSIFDGTTFSNFTRDGGHLNDDQVTCALEGADGAMWVGTRSGLAREKHGLWSWLDQRDGLAGNQINSVAEDPPGTFWLLTNSGMTRYEPRRHQPPPPGIHMRLDRDVLPLGSGLHVPQGRQISFKLEAIDLSTRPETRRYRYRIWNAASGLVPPWTTLAGGESELSYFATNRGHYHASFEYADAALNISAPTTGLITVAPLWYRDARILAPLIAVNTGLIAWAAIARSLYLRKRKENERLRERLFEEERKGRAAAERAREASDEANRAKSQFLASMSHELRTPLNAIIGYSEMLDEAVHDDGHELYSPDLQKIRAAARHQLTLVNDILDLSKIEAGKMTLFLEEFPLPALLREAAATVEPLLSRNGNRLDLEISPDLGAMHADQTKLRQTLLNLLSNATKFTSKGVITLRAGFAETSKSLVALSISDTGIGMTPDQMSRLFQAFSQGEASTQRNYGGTGLGLVISRRFCRLMGGDVSVRSETGQGTTFTVTLPIRVTDPATTNPS